MANVNGPGLSTALDISSQRWGDRIAVHSEGLTYSYEDLWRRSRQFQTYLSARGITAGARIAWMLPNGIEAATVCFGALGLGCVLVPINPLLSTREIAHHLSDSEASLIFVDSSRSDEVSQFSGSTEVVLFDTEFWDQLKPLVPARQAEPINGSVPAYIIYTSGTTGTPKGVTLSHDNLAHTVGVATSISGAVETDVIFGGLPLTHIFGQSCALHGAVRVGAAVTLDARFSAAEAINSIRRHAVTIFVGVPTMFTGLLSQLTTEGIENLHSSLRVIISGGAALPSEVVNEVRQRLGAYILESYGLTEAAGYVLSEQTHHVLADLQAGTRVPGSVGTPVPKCEVRIVDPSGNTLGAEERGELLVRGDNVMLGYWKDPASTKAVLQDGWLTTGDLAYHDAHGRYFIIGRTKELIVRGGYNVHPREVEEVLHSHPLVESAAVIGRPDKRLGEEIIAAIVFKRHLLEQTEDESIEQVKLFAKQQLAAYKYPRHFKVFDQLPMNSTGKVLKSEITPF